jgi:hypothetical protein
MLLFLLLLLTKQHSSFTRFVLEDVLSNTQPSGQTNGWVPFCPRSTSLQVGTSYSAPQKQQIFSMHTRKHAELQRQA